MTGPYDFGPFRQRDVLTMGRYKYGDDLTRDVLTMEGRFDWGRYDFGTFRRRDVLTVGRFDCKAVSSQCCTIPQKCSKMGMAEPISRLRGGPLHVLRNRQLSTKSVASTKYDNF